MIVSHEHKFIFLKTKKTAGTSIELALTELCGPGRHHSFDRGRRGAARQWTRAAESAAHGWWDSPRPLLKRRWFKFTAADYGFYNHMPAAEARARIGDKVWQSYFKFAFDRNPWDRQVSFYHHRYRNENAPPSFAAFMHEDTHARMDNFDIYSIDGDVAVDFDRTLRNSRRGSKDCARARGLVPVHRSAARQDRFSPHDPSLSRLL